MNCLANDIFTEKMQNLIWDDLLRDKNAWESLCHDKTRVTDFINKTQTIIDLDCLIEKLGGFVPDMLTNDEYTQLAEIWNKTKKVIKFS
jgi:hypothetical protein